MSNVNTIKARLTEIKAIRAMIKADYEGGDMPESVYLSARSALMTERDELIIKLGAIRLGFDEQKKSN